MRGRVLPNGRVDLLRQCALFGLAYLLYRLGEGAAFGGNTAIAFTHARELISLERSMHIFVEPTIQGWATSSYGLIAVAAYIYINAQTTILIALLLYLYIAHNRCYYFVRNMLFVGMFIGLIGYAVFPTAPPRFLPEWGFIDSVSDFTGVRVNHASASMSALFNPYAAVPSMHVAFALMVGWPLARLTRRRVVKAAWLLYPFLMAFVIVVTANHFIVDALLGALTAGASAYGASWLARARPNAWRFSTVPGSAASPAGARLTTNG